jgi:diaminopimelate dehydrogenase
LFIFEQIYEEYNMGNKIRAAVIGYGNIGRYVIDALENSSDFEIAGIVRRDTTNIPGELQEFNVVSSIVNMEAVDVAILCTPTRSVEQFATDCLALGINTVDSFDIHGQILALRTALDALAKKNNAVSIIASGWDPGSDSVIRTLFEAMAPRGITYTNFGPGMSMGHTVAVKAIPGVKAALSMTIPTGTGVHRRMVYIELQEGYNFQSVAQAIKEDDYFVHDETHVFQVEDVEALKDMGHGVLMERKGVSGKTQNQLFTFDMRINNPALTAQVLVGAARASMKQQPGAYTLIEIPVVDLLPGEKESWIKKLV